MHLKKNKAKGIAIDGIPIRKAAELFRYRESGGIFSGRPEYHQKRTFREKKIYGFGTLSVK